MSARDKLNQKQIEFCEAYVDTGNGTASAKKAGYSEASASSTAYDLLKNPKVVDYIDELNDLRFKEIQQAFRKHTNLAVRTLVEVCESDQVPMARVQAANSILEKAGHGSTNTIKSEIKATVESNVTVTSDDARRSLIEKFAKDASEVKDSESDTGA